MTSIPNSIWLDDPELEIDSEVENALHNAVKIFEKTKQLEKKEKKSGRQPNHEKWELMRSAFEKFYLENGRYPKSSHPDESALCNWCHVQNDAYNYNKLYQSRIDALNATEGWVWRSAKKAKKRKLEETEPEPEPMPKRRRLEIPWIAQEEQVKFVQKISELEEQLKEKDIVIQKQFAIMERQYQLIEELKKRK